MIPIRSKREDSPGGGGAFPCRVLCLESEERGIKGFEPGAKRPRYKGEEGFESGHGPNFKGPYVASQAAGGGWPALRWSQYLS